MSDRSQRIPSLGGAVSRIGMPYRRYVRDPLGRLLGQVVVPVERGLSPITARVNRYLGPHFGTVTGLQFLLLVVVTVGLVTAPEWDWNVYPPLTLPLVPLDLVTEPIQGWGSAYLRTLGLACIWAVFAMGWDIQSGYTGYISFGHSVLSGAAGYATALLVAHAPDPFTGLWVTIPLSILAACVVGLLIAFPTLRLQGPYFSLITFVAVLLLFRLTKAMNQWTNGLRGIRVDVWSFDPATKYLFVLFPMLAVALLLTYVSRSNVGTILIAIRENEDAVTAAGIDTMKFKLWSFVLSSVPMGLGGVLLAHFVGGVDPGTFVVLDNSIQMIAMTVIGGMSSILGALGGAFAFVFLRDEFLQALGWEARWIVLWSLVLLVLVFARRGLFRKIWHTLGALGGDHR